MQLMMPPPTDSLDELPDNAPHPKTGEKPPPTRRDITPRSAPAAMTIGPDWRLILNESFSTSNLDMQKWWTRYIYSGGMLDYLNDEWQRFREDGNHVMTGSQLQLTALPYDEEQGCWPSGMIRSKDKFDLGNGDEWYFEARLKVPGGLGVWPAFWLAGVERNAGDDSSCYWPPEFDILEIVNNQDGDDTTKMHCGGKGWDDWQNNTWTWVDDTFVGEWAYWQAPFDFAAAFHTVGFWYQRPNFTVYVDRKPILAGTYAWNDWMGESPGCHVLCNLAIGGSWAGRTGVDNDAFPQSLNVDYVHVYQRVAQSTIGYDLLPK